MCVTLLKKFLLEIKIVIVKFEISISVQWAKQASRQTAGKEDGEEVISPDGQYLMHMAAQSWLLLGGATKLNITQKRFLLLSSAPRTIRCAAATPPPQPLVQSQLSTTTVQPYWDCAPAVAGIFIWGVSRAALSTSLILAWNYTTNDRG